MLIADFDGTLTRLRVDWDALRASVGVRSIGDLWQLDDPAAFVTVAAAERDGAREADADPEAAAFVRGFAAFAILTDNSETAVAVFLERHPHMAQRCLAVAGRESLRGSKRDPVVFRAGIDRCVAALGAPALREVTYLGDTADELRQAGELGLRAVDVASLR